LKNGNFTEAKIYKLTESSDIVAEQQGFRCDASALKLHSLGLEVIMSSDY